MSVPMAADIAFQEEVICIYGNRCKPMSALTSADVHDCLDLEASHHIHCGGTADHKNAVEAFIEKRAPVFEGK